MTMIDSLPADLQPYEAELFAAVSDGLLSFANKFAQQRPFMTKRSERSNIHDCICAEARRYFEVMERLNLRLIKIGRYRVKVKKFNRSLQAKNSSTQLVLDFLRQRLPRTLFGMGTVSLHIGYVPDELDVTKSSLWITKPSGGRTLEWAYEMTGRAASALPALPVTQPGAPPASGTPRFTPKRDAQRKSSGGSSK